MRSKNSNLKLILSREWVRLSQGLGVLAIIVGICWGVAFLSTSRHKRVQRIVEVTALNELIRELNFENHAVLSNESSLLGYLRESNDDPIFKSLVSRGLKDPYGKAYRIQNTERQARFE